MFTPFGFGRESLCAVLGYSGFGGASREAIVGLHSVVEGAAFGEARHRLFADGSGNGLFDAIGSLSGGSSVVVGLFIAAAVFVWLSLRYIPHNAAGVVEKLWSLS